MILDHIGYAVSDYKKSLEFYKRALAPLDITLVKEGYGWAGFGKDGRPQFWIGGEGEVKPNVFCTHVAFVAKNRAAVRAFYEAAMAAGGKDNGGPGVREMYHPNYYGAFVLDPDGHNIEAVCHHSE